MRTSILPGLLVASTVAVPAAAPAIELSVGSVSVGVGVSPSSAGPSGTSAAPASNTIEPVAPAVQDATATGTSSLPLSTSTQVTSLSRAADLQPSTQTANIANPVPRSTRESKLASNQSKSAPSRVSKPKRAPVLKKPASTETTRDEPPIASLPTAAERLTALLAIMDQCNLSGLDLKTVVDDRRVVIVPITQILNPDTLSQFKATLMASHAGRLEAEAAVDREEGLRAVLARKDYDPAQVLALDIERNGVTYIFVDDKSEPRDRLSYVSEPTVLSPEIDRCIVDGAGGSQPIDDRVQISSLEPPPIGSHTVARLAPAAMSRLSVLPEISSPQSPDITSEETALQPDADLGGVSDLLERIARLDALLVALSAPEQETSANEAASAGDHLGLLVAGSHAVAEMASRSAGLGIRAEDVQKLAAGDGTIAGVVQVEDPPPTLVGAVSAPLALAGLWADADGGARVAMQSPLSSSVNPAEFVPDACGQEMSADLAAQFGAATRIQVVPLAECAAAPQDENQMRDLLWRDQRVRTVLLAQGYDESDVEGGEIGGSGQILSVYVLPKQSTSASERRRVNNWPLSFS